jgi:hypothetical protein
MPAAGDDEIIIAWGGMLVPDEEPGVDVEFGATEPAAGALMAGSPFPGYLFVLHPNNANEPMSASAANPRRPFRSTKFVVFEVLRMCHFLHQ